MQTSDSSEVRLERSANWTRHWASGTRHSCAGSFGAEYGGAIAEFWSRCFAEMPSGARVLDIATGNGALPMLLVKSRPAFDWHCDAVDLAQVAPAPWRSGEIAPPVRFHPGIAAEQLPFQAATFDLVVSQYGLEYSDLSASVAELLRVLSPGGSVALLVHHERSRPALLAQVEVGHIDWLLSPQGLLQSAESLIEPLSRASTRQGREALRSDRLAEEARDRFNAAQDELALRARSADGADVLHETQNRTAQCLQIALSAGAQPASAALQAVTSALQDARWRLIDLRRHALSDGAVEELVASLRDATGRADCGALVERGYLMGWYVHAGARAA